MAWLIRSFLLSLDGLKIETKGKRNKSYYLLNFWFTCNSLHLWRMKVNHKLSNWKTRIFVTSSSSFAHAASRPLWIYNLVKLSKYLLWCTNKQNNKLSPPFHNWTVSAFVERKQEVYSFFYLILIQTGIICLLFFALYENHSMFLTLQLYKFEMKMISKIWNGWNEKSRKWQYVDSI